MTDLEETLVLNYFVDDLEKFSETKAKNEDSLDENQNAKNSDEKINSKTEKEVEIETLQKPSRKRKRSTQKTQTEPLNGIRINTRSRAVNKKINELKNPVKVTEKKVEKSIRANSAVIKVENNENSSSVNKINGTTEIKTELPDSSIKNEAYNAVETKKQQVSPNGSYIIDLKPKCKLQIRNVYKCNQCLYVGNSKASLERHTLIHKNPDEILWYKCADCDYKSKYESQLKSHTIIHKNPNDIQYFQCPHCELKCSRKHNLKHHIKSIHADRVNNLMCAECSYSTFSKDRLVAHLKRHSSMVFMCTLCKFVTKRKEYLESHFKSKHTEVERPFPCDTCSYKGKTKKELDRHYNRMHNKEQLRVYQCNHCDFNSIYKKNLEYHLLHMHQNSEGFQKYVCGHCEKEFSYKSGLKTHIIRIHLKLTDEDWHKCQECKYKCKDVNTLKRHIKRNHGAKKLYCKQCNFGTNRQKSMTAHLQTHEGGEDQILKCPKCPYRIIQTVSFLYHMRVVHKSPVSSKDIAQYTCEEKS